MNMNDRMCPKIALIERTLTNKTSYNNNKIMVIVVYTVKQIYIMVSIFRGFSTDVVKSSF